MKGKLKKLRQKLYKMNSASKTPIKMKNFNTLWKSFKKDHFEKRGGFDQYHFSPHRIYCGYFAPF